AIAATAFWSLLGIAIGRRLLPKILVIGAAPILGWSVYNAVTLPIFVVVGFSFTTVSIVAAIFAIAALAAIYDTLDRSKFEPSAFPKWAFLAAAALALVPAAAIVPKISADAVQLASPIFDHSKIPMIDAMVRHGVPPVNPFFDENGELGRLVYYYLWYFSAA